MKTILVTGVGGPAGRAVALQLAALQESHGPFIVVGADMAEVEHAAITLVEVVPAASDPAYLPAMRELIGRVRADLVIPTVQDELVILANAAPLVGSDPSEDTATDAGAPTWFVPPVVVSAPTPTAIAADKLLTMWALAESGVPVPRFGTPSAFTTTQHAMDVMGGPLVVKPRVSRGGRGVVVVDDPRELAWASLDDGLIVQEFAPGTEYAVQAYRSPHGGDVEVFVLEKTEMQHGRVGNAVTTRRLEAGAAYDIELVAERAVLALDLTGPLDMDIRLLADGTAVVLEVNARFGANSAMTPELLHRVLADYALADDVLVAAGSSAARVGAVG